MLVVDFERERRAEVEGKEGLHCNVQQKEPKKCLSREAGIDNDVSGGFDVQREQAKHKNHRVEFHIWIGFFMATFLNKMKAHKST